MRLPEARGGGLMAVKPSNLTIIPSAQGDGDQRVKWLLDLPSDVLEALFTHLSMRSRIHLGKTCTQLQAIAANPDEPSFTSLLAHPLLLPYHTEATGYGGKPVPLEDKYRSAVQIRRNWCGDPADVRPHPMGGLVSRRKTYNSFERFQRSVSCDFIDDRGAPFRTIAVGLSNGAVACPDLAPRGENQDINSLGTHDDIHEEQVLTVDVSAAAKIVLSGCGRPSYPVSYPEYPYRPTVKVWKLDNWASFRGGWSESVKNGLP